MGDKTVFPLSAPSISDGAITVDLMLKEPTRIDNYISQLVEKNLLSTLFYNSVSAEGGALMFDQMTENVAHADNEPGVVSPGGEFPILWTSDAEPKLVTVQKTGGKFPVTDEAIRRNDQAGLQRKIRQVANTMVRDLDRRGMAAMHSAMEQIPDTLAVESGNWQSELTTTKANTTAQSGSGVVTADLARATNLVENTDLGYVLDTIVLHPDDALNLKLLLGSNEWTQVLGGQGLTPHVTTAAMKGSPILLAAHQIGSMGVETPISTEAWRDPETQKMWSQTWASVAFGITDPFAMVVLDGVGDAAPDDEGDEGESGNG